MGVLSFVDVVCFGAGILAALIATVNSGSTKKIIEECVGQHVCTTLMRYPDNYTANEGPNCICPNKRSPECDGNWEEHSPYTLTWQHYERSHWLVLYKFCTPLFEGRRLCQAGERAATVATEVNSWHPDLAEPRCRCPNDRFQLQGWKREGAQWKYYYVCDKKECTDKDLIDKDLGAIAIKEVTPCAKVIIDPNKSLDKVLEVHFICACPEGQMCPAHMKKGAKPEHGKNYVINYCENNVKNSGLKKG